MVYTVDWIIFGLLLVECFGEMAKKHRGKVVQQKEKTIPLSKDI